MGRVEAYTAYHHLRAVAGTGVIAGVFILNEYVTRKGLGGSRWHILALLLIPALGQFVAVFWNPFNPGAVLGKRPFRTVAIPVHLLLLLPLLGLLPGEATPLVALLALCGLIQMFLVPLQNGILARNYGAATRGRRYGLAHAVQALAIVIVSVPAGRLLDAYPDAWRGLYALAAVAAVYAYLHWSRLKRRRAPPRPAGIRDHHSPWEALRKDASFRYFELCFMLYGLGFLMLQPVLPLYLIDERGITYTQVGQARGAMFWATMVVVAPFLGRLCDRIGVLKLGALSFLTLSLFPLLLILVPGDLGLYLAFGVYGLGMSGVFLVWTLGPMHMAGPRDPLPYLNAHMGLVGFRALVGLVGGTLLQQHLGSRAVFVVVIALEIVAAVLILRLARRTPVAPRPSSPGPR